jgi:hypothetical protein
MGFLLCDSFTHICTFWINEWNLILFGAWKHYPLWPILSIWTCLGVCLASITLFYIYYACPSKEKHVLCLCQPSLWQITCLMFMLTERMTNLSMHMVGFMTDGHHPVPYLLLCMPIWEKKKKKTNKQTNMYYVYVRAGFSLPKKFLVCPGPAGFNYEKFLGVHTLPVGYSWK